jgi:hypothetical protein
LIYISFLLERLRYIGGLILAMKSNANDLYFAPDDTSRRLRYFTSAQKSQNKTEVQIMSETMHAF